jgi:hypothetical protein
MLIEAVRNPPSVLRLSESAWTDLIAIARAESLLGTLAHRCAGLDLPERVAAALVDARRDVETAQRQALWEAEMARRALAPLGVPVILLKGTAYLAAGLPAAEGRSIGDLDILVPRAALPEVEAALLGAGWEWVKDDPYDQHYYREWMHELPPLIHRERDRMIDVHHTILPLTHRRRPDADALVSNSLIIPSPFGLSLSKPLSSSSAHGREEEGVAFDKLRPNGRGGQLFTPPAFAGGAGVGRALALASAWWANRRARLRLAPPPAPPGNPGGEAETPSARTSLPGHP